jgi:MFS family permease
MKSISSIQLYALFGTILGALLGTFVISRLFWLVTKRWPDDNQKALFLNGVCGVIIISVDYLVRPNADFIFEVLLYGSCQMIVLFYDLWRIAGARKKSSTESREWIDADKDEFKRLMDAQDRH